MNMTDSKTKLLTPPLKALAKVSPPAGSDGLSKIRIGLEMAPRALVVAELNACIANASVLHAKTKKVHWDVVGPSFRCLHQLLDENATQISAMVDGMAERARMLGGHTIGTLVDFLEHSEITESREVYSAATEAVHVLVADHETAVRRLRKAVKTVGDAGDAGTADMFTGMLRAHEQLLWMLRSFVEGESVVPAGDAKMLKASLASNGRLKPRN